LVITSQQALLDHRGHEEFVEIFVDIQLTDRKDYRPEKHDSYEDADHGYRKNYGSKDSYKGEYRKGFLRGYQDAFNRRER
jgi:hypothetical protein